MRTKYWATFAVSLLGCGGAAGPERTIPSGTERSQTTTTDATSVVQAPAVDADDATTERVHVGEVRCRYDVPLDEVPAQPELLRSGDLVVRAQSLVWDHQGEHGVQYCEISEPLPEGAHLVVEVNDYGGGVGVWTGTSFIDPRQASGSLPPDVVVVLPGQAVTAVRWMDYCPVDPSRACLAAGDVQALSALSSFDPNGPRSGWDFTETAFPLEPATQAGRALEADACGLRVSLRGELACEGASVQALLPCLIEDYVNQAWGEEAEQEANAPAQLVFSDGVHEVAVVANETAGVSCIQNVVVVYGHAEGGMGSLRGFKALEVAHGRIQSALGFSIRDHEEARSDCGNAWDGVNLLPIVGSGRLIGGVVRGAGRSARFDVARGDVGEATFVPSHDDEAPMPLAYRVTPRGLAPIGTGVRQAAALCPLRVADEDGETNVRPDPSTRHTPVGTIPTGTEIHTVEQRGRWYRIEQPLAGWVWAESLSRRCAD